MTRKDYILIAEALRNTHAREVELNGQEGTAGGIRLAASALADALASDNPRFDRKHFLAVVHGDKDLHSRPARKTSILNVMGIDRPGPRRDAEEALAKVGA